MIFDDSMHSVKRRWSSKFISVTIDTCAGMLISCEDESEQDESEAGGARRHKVQKDTSNAPRTRRALRRSYQGPKTKRISTPQNGRKKPNSPGRSPESRRGTTEVRESRGCIGRTHARAQRSNRRKNNCKNNIRHQQNPKGAETAKLICWRENSAHRAGGTMRMGRTSTQAYRVLNTTRKRLKT